MTAEIPETLPLIPLTLKATVLLLAAAGASFCLRKKSAALRHMVWVCCAAGLLALPVLPFVLPVWSVPVAMRAPVSPDAGVPSVSEVREAVGSAGSEERGSEGNAAFVSEPDETVSAIPAGPASSGGEGVAAAKTEEVSGIPWVWAWPAGALFLLLVRLAGDWRIRRVRRGCRRADSMDSAESLVEACRQYGTALGLKKPPRLLIGADGALPFTCGVFSPRIVLPKSALDWDAEKRRFVLLHELAHVKRRDCLTQGIGHLARACFWFHPLAWWMTRRMGVERERACDDVVLAAGEPPSRYSQLLLALASGGDRWQSPPLGTLAMARKSTLEGRLLAVLDRRRDRRGLNRAALATGLSLAAAAVVPLAMLEAGEGEAETPEAETGRAPNEEFVAELERDVSVRMVAVADDLVEPKNWWAPDGGGLDESPSVYPHHHFNEYPDTVQREFVFEIGNPQDLDISVDVQLTGADEAESSTPVLPGSGIVQVRYASVLPEEVESVNLRVGVGLGEWEVVKSSLPAYGVGGGSLSGREGSVFFAQVSQRGDSAVTTVAYDLPKRGAIRLIAVDSEGVEHSAMRVNSKGSSSIQFVSAEFPGLAVEEVAEFRFEERPYQWIEFRNVSVRPGHATEVRIERLTTDSEESRVDEAERRLAERRLANAEQRLHDARVRYEAGDAGSGEVADAEVARMEAEVALARIDASEAEVREHELRLAEIRLEREEHKMQQLRSLQEVGRANWTDIIGAEVAVLEAELALVRIEGNEAEVRELELRLAEKRLENEEQRLQQVRSLHDMGRVTRTDLLAAESAVLHAELALHELREEHGAGR